MGAEAQIPADLLLSYENGSLNFIANAVPLAAVECSTGLNGNNLGAFKPESDTTLITCLWQVKHIPPHIPFAVQLPMTADAFLKQDSQIYLIQIGPGRLKKIILCH